MVDSATANGSTTHPLDHEPETGSVGTSPPDARDTTALAAAISVARAPAARTLRSARSAVAKKPQPEPTSARTPMPESACWFTESTSPLRADIDSYRRCITRASA